MISGSSVLSALAIYTFAMVPLFFLRKREHFLMMGGISILLAASLLIAVRLLLPLEIPITHPIHSWNLLGVAQRFIRAHPDFFRLLRVIWIVGAVIVVTRDVYILWRAHKACRNYTKVDSPEVQKIAESLSITCPVVVSPQVSGPFVTGPLRHTIYLPILELPEEEIELILRHEREHIRFHDAKIKLFYGVLSAVLWWNPVALVFRKTLDTLLEMRCDKKVMSSVSSEKRKTYYDMILALSELAVLEEEELAFSLDESAAMRRTCDAKRRLQLLSKWVDNPPQRQKRSSVALGCCLAVVLFFASYLVVFQPAGVPPANQLVSEPEIYYHENFEAHGVGDGTFDTFIFKDVDGRYHLYRDYEFSGYLSYEEVTSDVYQDLFVFEEGELE